MIPRELIPEGMHLDGQKLAEALLENANEIAAQHNAHACLLSLVHAQQPL